MTKMKPKEALKSQRTKMNLSMSMNSESDLSQGQHENDHEAKGDSSLGLDNNQGTVDESESVNISDNEIMNNIEDENVVKQISHDQEVCEDENDVKQKQKLDIDSIDNQDDVFDNKVETVNKTNSKVDSMNER